MSARRDDAAVADAARNNAAWCDLFAGLHGIRGSFAADAWTSSERTPERYPDAVTLQRSVGAERMLSRIDASPGASVKDSFADLDLAPWGFQRLFQATWIRWTGRASATTGGGSPSWEAIRDPAALRAWEAAWGVPDGERRRFLPGLLGATGVVVLAAVEAGTVGGGAILNEADGVVGLSNLFVASTDASDGSGMVSAFASAAGAARRLFPGRDLVGYEGGADLDAALAAGFEPLGPLTVWNSAVTAPTPIIVSDMDGTLTTAETWRGVHAWILEHRPSPAARRFVMVRLPLVALAKVGVYDKEAFRGRWLRDQARLLRGASAQELVAMGEWVVERYLWPARRQPAADAVGAAVSAARVANPVTRVMLATGGYQPVGDAFARRIGAELALGTPLEVRDGVATGALAAPTQSGQQKAAAIRSAAGGGEILAAFGDTGADVPMLAMARRAVAVAPDAALRREAVARGWEILEG